MKIKPKPKAPVHHSPRLKKKTIPEVPPEEVKPPEEPWTPPPPPPDPEPPAPPIEEEVKPPEPPKVDPVKVEEAIAPAPAEPVQSALPEHKHELTVKVSDLDFEICRQEGSRNMRLCFEDGQSRPIADINTILLWEILKAVSK